MVNRKLTEMMVGIFVILALVAFVFLAFRVSGLSSPLSHRGYNLTAQFDNIGGLKVRAPVTVAGVRIGEVTAITLDPMSFRALVTLHINSESSALPVDTSARILTQGLLGANYIGLSPGGMPSDLKNGDHIQTTYSALVLENLISQFLFSMNKK